jgi:intein/homing endonuclease
MNHVKPGDTVLAFDAQIQCVVESTVLEVQKHSMTEATELLAIAFADGTSVTVTPWHPFLSDRSWVYSQHLRPSMDVIAASGKVRVRSVQPLRDNARFVYNLVTEHGTYLVGQSGVVVSGQVAPADDDSANKLELASVHL